MKNRILDLANRAFNNSHYTFTNFMSEGELADFYSYNKEISFVQHTIFGGASFCDRKIIRFGSPEELGYEEDFPIQCVYCRPMAPKFAGVISHRDVLGSLMNLGIERDTLGDIFIKEKECYFFCLTNISDYIIDELTRIKHTNVICEKIDSLPETFSPKRIDEHHVVSSARADAIIAKVCKLSRSQSIALFQEKKIFVNGKQFENNSGALNAGDIVSVRGYGKFEFVRISGETKKGRINVNISRYA